MLPFSTCPAKLPPLTGSRAGPFSSRYSDCEGRFMKRIYFICLFLCLTTFAARPAHAQTETVLYNFCSQYNCSDGEAPGGNLYGTTLFGGANGYGTVFELSPSGGGWTEQVIYDAGGDSGLTMDTAGNIYGTTTLAVFELSPNGNGGWNPTVIHTFPSGAKDGSVPWGTPVLD